MLLQEPTDFIRNTKIYHQSHDLRIFYHFAWPTYNIVEKRKVWGKIIWNLLQSLKKNRKKKKRVYVSSFSPPPPTFPDAEATWPRITIGWYHPVKRVLVSIPHLISQPHPSASLGGHLSPNSTLWKTKAHKCV